MDDETLSPGYVNLQRVAEMLQSCLKTSDDAQGVFLYNRGGTLAIVTFNATPVDVFNMAIQTAYTIEKSVTEDMPPKEMFN
jgi:hypothetical protein